MHFRFNTDDTRTMFEEFTEGLEVSGDNPTFVFRIKASNDADEAMGELEEKVEEAKMML